MRICVLQRGAPNSAGMGQPRIPALLFRAPAVSGIIEVHKITSYGTQSHRPENHEHDLVERL